MSVSFLLDSDPNSGPDSDPDPIKESKRIHIAYWSLYSGPNLLAFLTSLVSVTFQIFVHIFFLFLAVAWRSTQGETHREHTCWTYQVGLDFQDCGSGTSVADPGSRAFLTPGEPGPATHIF